MLLRYKAKSLVLLFAGLIIASCGVRDVPAPVADLRFGSVNLPAGGHVVKRGETLYAIAFLYDIDYRQLAKINNIKEPYTLAVGQLIKFQAPKQQFSTPKYQQVYRRPVQRYSFPKRNQSLKNIPLPQNGLWFWPIKGQIKSYYAPYMARKGIEIAGKKGDKVHAAQNGVVAYSGNGLANYGNLIIIRHPNNYLTAYANNAKNLVKEGQYVRSGQIIAEIGIVNHQYYGLHFEIRERGKPLNPLKFLKN